MATEVSRKTYNCQHSMEHLHKLPYRRKNLAKFLYTNKVIATFVSNFAAMGTGDGWKKMQLAAFDGPSSKTPL